MLDAAYAILVDELRADPLGRGYAVMDDAGVAADLNAFVRTKQGPVPITECIRWLARWDGLSRLTSTANTGAVAMRKLAKAALVLIQHPQVTSLDVTDPEIGGMVQSLVTGAVFTQAEIDDLKSLGNLLISRATELGLSYMYPGYVQSARAKL